MEPEGSRRPLKSRSTRWAAWAAAGLARAGVSPNTISAASLVVASIGAVFFIAAGQGWITPWIGWTAGAACIQLRLLCNLLDGMVAIEGGQKSPTGGVWNEMPDRFADTLLLMGAAVGCDHPWAGAAAAWTAVMAAYTRSLGAELTGRHDFCGPMAKPHRMALLTAGVLLTAADSPWSGEPRWMPDILWLIAAGTLITIVRRLARLSAALKSPTP